MTFSPTLLYSLFWLGVFALYCALDNSLHDQKLSNTFTLCAVFIGIALVAFSISKQLAG